MFNHFPFDPMFTFFLIIFLSTIFLCLCTYVFYPISIWILGKLFPFKVLKGDAEPTISIIIPAYNETKNIQRKIENTLSLKYPKDKTEILVGSDGSTDETVAIVHKLANRAVRLLDFKENRGKTAVQNDLVRLAKGEVLVFTDAASFLHKDALKRITLPFADDRVGCVAGRMRFLDTKSNLTTQSQGIYWRYEVKMREMESTLGSVIGVDGPLYAVRKDSYIPLDRTMMSDFVTPLLVLAQGKKVVLEPNAIADELPKSETRHEFITRRRIAVRGLVSLSAHPDLLNPLKLPFLSLQIVFHKVLRWIVGPVVILNLLACVALMGNILFQLILALYVLFLLAAAAGWLTGRQGLKVTLLAVPYYFILVNLAATVGIIDFFRGKQAVRWQPVRH